MHIVEKKLRAKKTILILLVLMGGLTVSGVILFPERADSGPFLNSTHGNSSYGVNRASISAFGYPKGHCSHCHEQHASIGGSEPVPNSPAGPDKFLLFGDSYTSQTDNVCLKCHVSTGSVQLGGTIANHSYSFRAGRLSPDFLSPADMVTAFSYCYSGCGTSWPPTSSSSSHNLANIRTFITDGSRAGWGYTSDSNPCVACHNPHMVIGDPANGPNDSKTLGTRGYSPVSRPSFHSRVTSDWGLWGDVAAERMDAKATSLGGSYQAPVNGGSSPGYTYEPDGSSTQNGSNLTDFVSFCTDCHANTGINTSHALFVPDPSPGQYPYPSGAMGRYTLFKIDWANEQHGGYQAFTELGCYSDIGGYLLADPYKNCGSTNYVLSCTDCHEPHGSSNNYLVRRRVNNNDPVTVTYYGTANGPDGKTNKEWVYLCGKCHTYLNRDSHHTHPTDLTGDPGDCLYCHLGGGNDYRNCGECHYHGSKFFGVVPLF